MKRDVRARIWRRTVPEAPEVREARIAAEVAAWELEQARAWLVDLKARDRAAYMRAIDAQAPTIVEQWKESRA